MKKAVFTSILLVSLLLVFTACKKTENVAQESKAEESALVTEAPEVPTENLASNNNVVEEESKGDIEIIEPSPTPQAETESEQEIINYDFWEIFGGYENYAQMEYGDFPFSEIDMVNMVFFDDGSYMTYDELDSYVQDADLPMEYKECIEGSSIDDIVYWALQDEDYGSEGNSTDVDMNPLDIVGKGDFKICRVRNDNEYNGTWFAEADVYDITECPSMIPYDGRNVRVTYLHYEAGREKDRIIIPESVQCAYFSQTTVNSLEIQGNNETYIDMFHCKLPEKFDISETQVKLWLLISSCEGPKHLVIPGEGMVETLELFRVDGLSTVNSDEAGLYNIPEGTRYVVIGDNALLSRINIPDSVEYCDLDGNDKLGIISYKGIDYTDLAEFQMSVDVKSSQNDMSMEMEGLEEDIKRLDADESNKDGREFSFIGKDYWQNNVFFTVWYENGCWRVKMDISEGGRDVHTIGYFDSDYIYHRL